MMKHANLEAELARHGISKRAYAQFLQIDYSTLFRKLSGESPFTIGEAFKTTRLIPPPANEITYLFAEEFKTNQSA